MHPLKYILLDFDGTLIDSTASLYQAYISLLKIYNENGNHDEFNKLNGPTIYEISMILKEKYSLSDPIEKVYENYKNKVQQSYSKSNPFQHSSSFLYHFYLKKIHLCLVSSSIKEMAFPIVKRLNWEKYFTKYTWGNEVVKSKPHPDIYLKTITKIGIDRSNTIVIEDSPNGIRSAKAANLNVFAITNTFNEETLKIAGANKCFKDLNQLLGYIEKELI